MATAISQTSTHCTAKIANTVWLSGLPDSTKTTAKQQLNVMVGSLVKNSTLMGFEGYSCRGEACILKSFNEAAVTFAIGEVFNGDVDCSPFQGAALDVLSYPMYFQLRNVCVSSVHRTADTSYFNA